MKSRFFRSAWSAVGLSVVASACSFGAEGDLARVQGMNRGLASCVLEQIDGRIETSRVVSIVDASVQPNATEEELVTRAFINCV